MGFWQKAKNLWSYRSAEMSFTDLLKYYGSFGHWGVVGTSPNTEAAPRDFETVAHDIYMGSGVVYMVAQARAKIFSEARFKWRRVNEPATPFNLFTSRGLDLLERPWQNGSTSALLMRAIQDVDIAGNFYCVRTTDHQNRPRLRRLRPDWVEVVLTKDPTMATEVDVLGYAYYPGGIGNGEPEYFSAEEVAHWAPDPDPRAQYLGMSWLVPVMEEVMTEKEAQKHRRNFFRRGAQLGVAVTVTKDKAVTADKMRQFKEEFLSKHQGARNAHEPLFLGPGADVKIIEADPSTWDTRSISGLAETHIAGVAGVPPVVAGLSEGLSGSTLNAGNYKVAARGFIDRTIRPLWHSFANAIEPLIDPPKPRKGNGSPARLTVDEREVSVLNDDRLEDADIMGKHTTTFNTLITNGCTFESAQEYIVTGDFTVLKDSGYKSVQLYKPGELLSEKDKASTEESDTPNKTGGLKEGGQVDPVTEPTVEPPDEPTHDPVTPKTGEQPKKGG